jgi:uncharacterized protein GlcG (DUF336 family)
MSRPAKSRFFKPAFESLERRDVPAFIASQTTLAPLAAAAAASAPSKVASQIPLAPPLLSAAEVKALLERASLATASNDAIIAVVDRNGVILGVRVEAGVNTALLANTNTRIFAVDGAVSLARTAAFFANDTAPLTSRTIQFISQSTVTQREVQSNPNVAAINSPLRGPGYVAPIGVGGHFPPNVAFTPQVDLFAIEHTNRDSFLNPGADHKKGTADDLKLDNRFNVDITYLNAALNRTTPLSYGEALLTPAQQRNPATNHFQSRGIATLPGGIPIYEYGTLVGGIGVFFPGKTGYATEMNSSLSQLYDPSKPDRTLEAEFMGLAAVGGSSVLGLKVGTLGNLPALPGFDFPAPRIDLVGITLDVVGPGGTGGPGFLVDYAKKFLGVGLGSLAGGFPMPVNPAGELYLPGQQTPSGWLVAPHDGVGITAAEVTRIITQGVAQANLTRAQIRTPSNQTTRMVFAVTDSTGEVLGLYRMPDATIFSIDVAVAKARNTAYYNDPTQLNPLDQVPGLPPGTSLTNRTFRYLAVPRYPISVEGRPPGPFSILNDPNINPLTGLQSAASLPSSAYTSILGFDSFNVGTNFHAPTDLRNQNGVVFFPGSGSVYKNGRVFGGYGVSGDGVDQDDVVTTRGISGFDSPTELRADQYFVRGVRLPFRKDPRNPERV